MPIDKEQFLKQFVKQALDERISLFLGAGGSCDAGYPNWADLFAPFARDLGTPINESTDYYRLAQYYSNRSEEHTLNSSHRLESRMPSSA